MCCGGWGELDAAKKILLELKALGEPDTYVDEELGLLGKERTGEP